MFKIVIDNLIKLLNEVEDTKVFTNHSFVNAIVLLPTYSIKCVSTNYLRRVQTLVIKLILHFFKIVYYHRS